MGDPYWRYGDSRGAAPPALPAGSGPGNPNSSNPPLKRHRPDYTGKGGDWRYGDRPGAAPPHADMKRPRADYHGPSGRDALPYYPPREDDRHGFRVVRDTEPIGASYDRYLRNGGGPPVEHGRPGPGGFPLDERRMMGGRLEPPPLPLPPDASGTLYVEGLPASCTRREVSHIFRPFVGYLEVRLVNKEGKSKDGNPHILCFVDFAGPAHAAVALDALQGYKLDEHDRDSPVLRLQFARNPGVRSGGPRRR